MNLTVKYLESLKHSWTAKVVLYGGQVINIWYTTLPMQKEQIKTVLSVSSNYPKNAADGH